MEQWQISELHLLFILLSMSFCLLCMYIMIRKLQAKTKMLVENFLLVCDALDKLSGAIRQSHQDLNFVKEVNGNIL